MLDVLFGDGPPGDLHPAFVNVTRSFIVDDRPLPAHAGRLVLEIVESVAADDAVLAGLDRLRSRGYKIAIDDFAAEPDQVAMLPYADYVKIDVRDVDRIGPQIVQLARRHGAVLVAERVWNDALVQECRVARLRPPAGRRPRSRGHPHGLTRAGPVSCRRTPPPEARPARRRTAGRAPLP